MNTRTRDVTSILGHRVTIFENDHISEKISEYGLYEKESLQFVLSLLARIEAPVILDVGANLGNHSLAYSTVARTVYSFEPMPTLFKLLNQNVRQNKLTNIKTFQLGLSNTNGKHVYYINSNKNLGASGFYPRESSNLQIEVDTVTGDQFAQLNNIKIIDFIKIDVEGHEQFTLEGLKESIEKFSPLLQIEWAFPKRTKEMTQSTIMNFLISKYTFYVLGTNQDRTYWETKPLAFIRKFLSRLFSRRKFILYEFNPSRIYKNLILIPKNKSHLFNDVFTIQK